VAADPLYQKQQLQRSFDQRRFDLKLRQRQQSQPPALQPRHPGEQQRLQDYHYRQQMQLRQLHEQQRQSLLPGQTDPEPQANDQIIERRQHAQDLDLKLESPPDRDACCPLEPQALD
jgi:hypothetical protein